MLIIDTEEARVGMTLAAPVAHPDNPEVDLLKRGYALEDSVLPRLRELGVPSLYVDFPGLDELDRHLAPQLSPARQAMYCQVRDTMRQVQGQTCPGVSFPDYYVTTREMITTLMSQGAHPVYMERLSGLGADAVAHATTVAHLALMIGLRLETYLIQQRARLDPQHAREVVNLGVSGMLHDIGKMKLPEALRNRSELDAHAGDGADAAAANDDERLEWESHAKLGFDMVRGGVESSAAAAVLHHHQRFDGTGFPAVTPPGLAQKLQDAAAVEPVKGRNIHVFARILYVADLYTNLARPPGARACRSNLEVLHLMRAGYAERMDPVIFRTLQAVAPPFLPGSKVVLDDRTTAAVMSIRPSDPYAPVVRRFKPDGDGLEAESVDLHDPGSPAIVAVGDTPAGPMMPGRPETPGLAAAGSDVATANAA